MKLRLTPPVAWKWSHAGNRLNRASSARESCREAENLFSMLKLTVTDQGTSTGCPSLLAGLYSQLETHLSAAPSSAELPLDFVRSEERRVGKECRSRWS